MPLPYPQNLTPDSPPYSSVQINEYWWSVIFGFADNALIRENWDVTDNEWENEVLPAVINALDTGMNCDCIKGLAFDSATGKLTYTDENDNTVTVQTGGDTFISNNYYVITANEADADDAYCYAAWMLAERAADDFQDMLEFIDIVEEVTSGAIKQFFASLIDLVPFFGDLAEAVIRIQDNLEEDLYDWVKENARDIEARAVAAEIIYCGIKIAMENGGQSSIRAGIIQAGTPDLEQFTITKVAGVWTIPDIEGLVEDAFSGLDGSLLGYPVVAWMLVTDSLLNEFGADRPLEAIMAFATKFAAAHDDRDCASFSCEDWCHVFDFTLGDELGWEADANRGTFSSGAWHTQLVGDNDVMYIERTVTGTFALASLRVKGSCTQVANGGTRSTRWNTTTYYGALSASAGAFDIVHIQDETGVSAVGVFLDTNGPPTGENVITEIEVCGTGTNPFL